MPRMKKPEPTYKAGDTIIGLLFTWHDCQRGRIIDIDSRYWRKLRDDNWNDGYLYLVEWPDRTRTWQHEGGLAPLVNEFEVIASIQAYREQLKQEEVERYKRMYPIV